ncbi:MAG: lipid-A-disaccharide synthase [Inquilinus sp.]|nr:lipid-A-disaccharide synthase [Inquilinus sp.]
MKPLTLFVVAGEASGDLIGGRLMAALKRRAGDGIRFAGIGGERMAAEGLDSLFPMNELSLMGLFEVLPRARHLLRRLRETAAEAERLAPDALITIDSPGFTLRLAERLAGKGIPLIHVVAPQVWAWRPGRAVKIAGLLDHLLALLPFEPPYFTVHGLPTTFIGHPLVESGVADGDGERFRDAHGIDASAPLLCVLPGSRDAEVERLLPIFGQAMAGLRRARPALAVAIPAASAVADRIRSLVAAWPGGAVVVEGDAAKYDCFAAADLALAASGTVTLELALAGTPMVVAYRVNALTAMIARRLVKLPHVALVNVVLGYGAVPELIQEECRADRLAAAMAALLDDPRATEAQRRAFAKVGRAVGAGGPSPSERAADAVLAAIGGGRSSAGQGRSAGPDRRSAAK